MFTRPEVGIYKRKQESKKTRKHAFDQEKKTRSRPRNRSRKNDNGQEKEERKHALDQESDQEKNEKLTFLFYFLVFFYKFSPQV